MIFVYYVEKLWGFSHVVFMHDMNTATAHHLIVLFLKCLSTSGLVQSLHNFKIYPFNIIV
jgi:hypothetical protein